MSLNLQFFFFDGFPKEASNSLILLEIELKHFWFLELANERKCLLLSKRNAMKHMMQLPLCQLWKFVLKKNLIFHHNCGTYLRNTLLSDRRGILVNHQQKTFFRSTSVFGRSFSAGFVFWENCFQHQVSVSLSHISPQVPFCALLSTFCWFSLSRSKEFFFCQCKSMCTYVRCRIFKVSFTHCIYVLLLEQQGFFFYPRG